MQDDRVRIIIRHHEATFFDVVADTDVMVETINSEYRGKASIPRWTHIVILGVFYVLRALAGKEKKQQQRIESSHLPPREFA